MPCAFDGIFVGFWKCTSVTNFLISGLELGNRVSFSVMVMVSLRVRELVLGLVLGLFVTVS